MTEEPENNHIEHRALATLTVICAALTLAVGALGIWIYSVNTDFLNALNAGQVLTAQNGVQLAHTLDVAVEGRRLMGESVTLTQQNHEALMRLLERMEVRNDQDTRRAPRSR